MRTTRTAQDWRSEFDLAYLDLVQVGGRSGVRELGDDSVLRAALGTVAWKDGPDEVLLATVETMRRIRNEGWDLYKGTRDEPLFEALWSPLQIGGSGTVRAYGAQKIAARRVAALYRSLDVRQRRVVARMLAEGARAMQGLDQAANEWHAALEHEND